MKIATYNIWNCDISNRERFDQIVGEINKIDADIIGLQEVANRDYHNELLKFCQYENHAFFAHSGEDEGVSVFSKHPIIDCKYLECALTSVIKCESTILHITNLHLDWKSALKREKEIIILDKEANLNNADYKFMFGDFNCSVNSSVHQYLLGQASLMGEEANPYWYDLAESYANISQTLPEITLDFKNNPRWSEKKPIETNQRFDRILIQNTYPKTHPVLNDCIVFGKEISLQTGIAPSDHYGVCVDLSFN